MLDSTLVLETDRVRLEPIGVAHLDDLRRNCNDPALWEFTYSADPFDTLERAQRWLREAVADRTCTFAIRDLASGETIGSTRYFDITPEHRKLEIGYTFIARRFWRTHVNTHCKLLLLQYAFESWHAARVQLKGEAINLRSRAAMERIGARYEGTLRNFRIHPQTGALRDVSFYSIIESEWPAVKTRLTDRIRDTRVAE